MVIVGCAGSDVSGILVYFTVEFVVNKIQDICM